MVISSVGLFAILKTSFFDHMLSQLGKHASFDLEIKTTGDIQVDSHHSVARVFAGFVGAVDPL